MISLALLFVSFYAKRRYGVLALCDDLRTPVSSSFVIHKLSGSNISRTVRSRIAELYIYTDMLYSRIAYDVTSYFQWEIIAKKPSKMPTPTASDGILESSLSDNHEHFSCLSGGIDTTILTDMTSLAASGRLQNTIKNCISVRKTGATGRRVE